VTERNLRTVIDGYEAFNRGDFTSSMANWHPEVEWHVLGTLPDAGVYRGRDQILRFFAMWRETFEGFHIEVEDTLDAGDRVVALIAVSGSGRGSGAWVRTPTHAQIWTFADGVVTRVEMLTKAEALATMEPEG
jgi:ketosteroid isomerase-like protein